MFIEQMLPDFPYPSLLMTMLSVVSFLLVYPESQFSQITFILFKIFYIMHSSLSPTCF